MIVRGPMSKEVIVFLDVPIRPSLGGIYRVVNVLLVSRFGKRSNRRFAKRNVLKMIDYFGIKILKFVSIVGVIGKLKMDKFV